jgi:hypothetical protein
MTYAWIVLHAFLSSKECLVIEYNESLCDLFTIWILQF